MGLPPSTRPSGSRERRSSAFIREDSGLPNAPLTVSAEAHLRPLFFLQFLRRRNESDRNGHDIVPGPVDLVKISQGLSDLRKHRLVGMREHTADDDDDDEEDPRQKRK